MTDQPTPSIEALCLLEDRLARRARLLPDDIDRAIAVLRQYLASSVPVLPTADSEAMELRKAIWLGHGHLGMYGDDGEMQCSECFRIGAVDYKRASPHDVTEIVRHLARLAAAQTPGAPSGKPDIKAALKIVGQWAEDTGKKNLRMDASDALYMLDYDERHPADEAPPAGTENDPRESTRAEHVQDIRNLRDCGIRELQINGWGGTGVTRLNAIVLTLAEMAEEASRVPSVPPSDRSFGQRTDRGEAAMNQAWHSLTDEERNRIVESEKNGRVLYVRDESRYLPGEESEGYRRATGGETQ